MDTFNIMADPSMHILLNINKFVEFLMYNQHNGWW